jgi:hypothetical protein
MTLTVTQELEDAIGGIEQLKEGCRLKNESYDPMLDEISAAIERALSGIQRVRCEAVAQIDKL